MSEVFNLLRHSQPGKAKTISDHIARGERIAEVIELRWDLSSIRAWKVKHLRWVLVEYCKDMTSSTRYDYWRTIRVLASALGRFVDWEPHLKGPWIKSGQGGRKPKLAHAGTPPS